MKLRLAILCLPSLVACAGAPTPESRVWIGTLEELHFQPDVEVESIPQFRIDGFKVLDSMHVVLYTGPRLGHVVTLREPCQGLESAIRLGYSTSAGALTRMDKLIPVDRNRSDPPCPVARIQTLKPVQVPR